MTKVTGIDIGCSCIHLVELDGSSRKYRMTKSVTLPRSALEPTEGEEPDDSEARMLLIDDLKAAFHEGVSSERGLIALSGAHCILRNITLPFRGRDEIHKVLKFEAEGYIHSHSIDDVVVDAVVVDERKDGTEMFMAACPKEALDEQLKALHKAGCDPERADLDATLLVEAGIALGVFEQVAEETPEEQTAAHFDLVLGIGAGSIQMVLVRNAQLWTVRVLRWGLNRLNLALAERLSVTEAEASAALLDWFNGATTASNDHADIADALPVTLRTEDLERASRDLAARIVKEITRFLSGFDFEHQPRRVFLTGGGSRVPGIMEAIAAETEVPTEPFNLVGRSGANGGDSQPELDVAFSAALAALGTTRSSMNFRQEELAFRPKFDQLKFPLAVCAMLLALFAFVKGFKMHEKIQDNERNIGIVDEKRSKKSKGRAKRLPEYTGLLRYIAGPERSYLTVRLDDRADAMKILRGLEVVEVQQRTGYIVGRLNKLKEKLETDTGYFRELKLESGLSVLQAFAAIVDKLDKDEGVDRFVIPVIHLQVGSTPKKPGSLKFRVAYRGDQLRERNDVFKRHMKAACGPQGPFESFEQNGNPMHYPSAFEPGMEYPYQFILRDDIPVFQQRGSGQ
ncbi:MAG: hypothetical protein CMJ85_10670 [Planctomycetes bacterium]|jgi:type IV pilus assembly protein PilM|nr:hypothetical protein [Planctomycetota bacterium]MDP6424919.1 pilus assembly protein PilM [Planctomycetota bacterium]